MQPRMTPPQFAFLSPILSHMVQVANQLGAATRVCGGCDRVLSYLEFGRDRSKASGLKSRCKACDRKHSREYYVANRQVKIEKSKARYAAQRLLERPAR